MPKMKIAINKKLLAYTMVLLAFTGSECVLFKIGGFPLTPMRIIGVFSIVYFILTTKISKTPMYRAFFIIAYIYMFLVTIIASTNRGESIMLWINYILYCMPIFVIIDSIKTKSDLIDFNKIYLIGVIATIAISIYEYITRNHIASNYTSSHIYSEDVEMFLLRAPTAFLHNPNNVGVFMLTAIPILFFFIDMFEHNKYKIYMYIILVSDLVVIFMTGSRSSLLIAAAFIYIRMLALDNSRWEKLVFFITVILLVILSWDFIVKQLSYAGLMDNGILNIFKDGDGGRIEIIENTWNEVVLRSPIIGSGVGAVEIITNSYAHNFPLEVLANYGLLGLGLTTIGILSLVCAKKNIYNKLYRDLFVQELIVLAFAMIIAPTLMTTSFIWVIVAFLISMKKIDWRE